MLTVQGVFSESGQNKFFITSLFQTFEIINRQAVAVIDNQGKVFCKKRFGFQIRIRSLLTGQTYVDLIIQQAVD